METNTTVAVLGCGQMGGALVRGFVSSGVIAGVNLRLFDVKTGTAQTLASEIGGVVAASATDAARGANLVLVCVKPAFVAPLLALLHENGALSAETLVVSIAAGVNLATLQTAAPNVPVIRVMPNTPALVGAGASASCRGAMAGDADANAVQTLFGAVGACVEVANETLINAVIGVSGSAPAYFYLVVEALTDGGVRAGLPRDIARTLAAQTMLGSAKMILETGTHPMALKDAVTTPGGTTIAALGVLESGGLRGVLMDAVQAAADRSKEMSG